MRVRINRNFVFGLLPYVIAGFITFVVLKIWEEDFTKNYLLSFFAGLYIVGGALGELLMRSVGIGLGRVERAERSWIYRLMRRWRWIWASAFTLGFVNGVSIVPIVPAISGVLAGSVGYPATKFFFYTFCGRSIGGTILVILFGETMFDTFCRNIIITFFFNLSACA